MRGEAAPRAPRAAPAPAAPPRATWAGRWGPGRRPKRPKPPSLPTPTQALRHRQLRVCGAGSVPGGLLLCRAVRRVPGLRRRLFLRDGQLAASAEGGERRPSHRPQLQPECCRRSLAAASAPTAACPPHPALPRPAPPHPALPCPPAPRRSPLASSPPLWPWPRCCWSTRWAWRRRWAGGRAGRVASRGGGLESGATAAQVAGGASGPGGVGGRGDGRGAGRRRAGWVGRASRALAGSVQVELQRQHAARRHASPLGQHPTARSLPVLHARSLSSTRPCWRPPPQARNFTVFLTSLLNLKPMALLPQLGGAVAPGEDPAHTFDPLVRPAPPAQRHCKRGGRRRRAAARLAKAAAWQARAVQLCGALPGPAS